MRGLIVLAAFLVAGCVSVTRNPPPASNTVVAPPGSTVVEDLVVRRIEWRLSQPATEEGLEAKPGSLFDVLVFCDRVDPSAKAFDPDAMLRSWLAAFPQSPEQVRDLMPKIFSSLGGSGSKGAGGEWS